jgi:hypothetical protein
MANRKSFIKLASILSCLLILSFSLPRAVNGQEERLPELQKDLPDGNVIIEGDIQVSRTFYKSLVKTRSPQSAYQKANTLFWPNGIVPFEFDGNCAPGSIRCVSAGNQVAMLAAMAVLQAVANVQFQQCAGNACSGNFVHIQNSAGNNSFVGVQGGRQLINITSWGSQFTIVHELLHCLGFFHEQSAPNRGRFVTINWCNIQGAPAPPADCTDPTKNPIANINFTISNDASVYGPYDLDSVMHYDACAFSIDCPAGAACNCVNATITVNPPFNTQDLLFTPLPAGQTWQQLIGQVTHLSYLDRVTVSFLYPQPDWRFVDQAYDGANGDPDGSFRRPFRDLVTGIANTPEGGSLWIQPGNYPAVGIHGRRITLQAPLGNVTLQ